LKAVLAMWLNSFIFGSSQ